MKTQTSFKPTVHKLGINNETIRVVEWNSDDPFPELGQSVGVDIETLIITDTCHTPDLVVPGVFDGEHRVSHIVCWQRATAFMRALNRHDVGQRYFNIDIQSQGN